MNEGKGYLDIVKHYEDCLDKHGDNHLGVDWPNSEDADKRYKVMLDIVRLKNESGSNTLLDFGCGTAHLLTYMVQTQQEGIIYSGLDLSDKFTTVCKSKYPGSDFYCLDILETPEKLPDFDYIVMNGVFTEKRDLEFEKMYEYFCELLIAVFAKAKKGIAFNIMSKHVDWERDDLFHMPFDMLAGFIQKHLSRHYIIRNDYGLFEYTVYIYRTAA